MHAFILQDFITIRGSTNTNVTQSESGWLDLTPYQDLVFWLDTKEVSGSNVTLTFQTSPTKDESLFTQLLAGATLAVGVVTKQALMGGGSTTNPCARYVRWALTAPTSGPWDATFRVYVAANSPGM